MKNETKKFDERTKERTENYQEIVITHLVDAKCYENKNTDADTFSYFPFQKSKRKKKYNLKLCIDKTARKKKCRLIASIPEHRRGVIIGKKALQMINILIAIADRRRLNTIHLNAMLTIFHYRPETTTTNHKSKEAKKKKTVFFLSFESGNRIIFNEAFYTWQYTWHACK